MTRPAGRVKGCSKSRGSGQGVFIISRVGSYRVKRFQNLVDRVGSGQEVSESHGSGRVGSIGFKISRVGSGRVKRFQNLAGRVRSGQEVSKSRGSGPVGSRGFRNLAGRVGS